MFCAILITILHHIASCIILYSFICPDSASDSRPCWTPPPPRSGGGRCWRRMDEVNFYVRSVIKMMMMMMMILGILGILRILGILGMLGMLG